jgi:sirohydrochlorin ferrochelatase
MVVSAKRRTLLAVAHGTRISAGQAQVRDLVRAVARRRPDLDIRLSYVDVQRPRLAEAVARLDRPFIAVPLLLANGHHVSVDIPLGVGDADAVTSPPLGPDGRLVDLLGLGLRAAGNGDAVVLAAAGSKDARARADVEAIARCLPVPASVGYASASAPRVPDVVARLRAAGARRVVIAAYLLTDGLFYRSLHRSGADAVTPPLAGHPTVADLVLTRYDGALGDL